MVEWAHELRDHQVADPAAVKDSVIDGPCGSASRRGSVSPVLTRRLREARVVAAKRGQCAVASGSRRKGTSASTVELQALNATSSVPKTFQDVTPGRGESQLRLPIDLLCERFDLRRSVNESPSRVDGYSRLSRPNASPRNRSSDDGVVAIVFRPVGAGARSAVHARAARSSAVLVSLIANDPGRRPSCSELSSPRPPKWALPRCSPMQMSVIRLGSVSGTSGTGPSCSTSRHGTIACAKPVARSPGTVASPLVTCSG